MYFRTYHIVGNYARAEIELFISDNFCFVIGITAFLKAVERQIQVLGHVRSTQEKEIIVIDQTFIIWKQNKVECIHFCKDTLMLNTPLPYSEILIC